MVGRPDAGSDPSQSGKRLIGAFRGFSEWSLWSQWRFSDSPSPLAELMCLGQVPGSAVPGWPAKARDYATRVCSVYSQKSFVSFPLLASQLGSFLEIFYCKRLSLQPALAAVLQGNDFSQCHLSGGFLLAGVATISMASLSLAYVSNPFVFGSVRKHPRHRVQRPLSPAFPFAGVPLVSLWLPLRHANRHSIVHASAEEG